MSGPIQGRGRGQLIDGINITPMVDIILVILVIFMAATTFVHERHMPVNLPTAGATAASQSKTERLTVTVDAQGRIFLQQNSSDLSLEKLGDLLAATARQTPGLHVDLRADRGRSYGEIIDVLEVVRAAGISSVGFAVAGS
jgi:biopolymer transport protein ExbD